MDGCLLTCKPFLDIILNNYEGLIIGFAHYCVLLIVNLY